MTESLNNLLNTGTDDKIALVAPNRHGSSFRDLREQCRVAVDPMS